MWRGGGSARRVEGMPLKRQIGERPAGRGKQGIRTQVEHLRR